VPTLVSPAPGASVVDDPGFIEINWADTGAGVNATTYSIDDVTITGVDVDVIFQPDINNPSRVQYFYDRDGEFLPTGNITVTLPGGKVFDRAGNANAALSPSPTFRLLLNLEAGVNVSTPLGTPAALSGASFRYDGLHSALTLTVDWDDGTAVQTVALAGTSGGGPINASHNYAVFGVYEPVLRLRDTLGREMTDTITVAVTGTCRWQNPLTRLDVNGDTVISPLDAVLVINDLNARGPRPLPNPPVAPDVPPPFLDVDCNGGVFPADAVEVINALNSGTGGEGELNDAFDQIFAAEAHSPTSSAPTSSTPTFSAPLAGPDYLSALAWLDGEECSAKKVRAR
jgi:hypothetical protein